MWVHQTLTVRAIASDPAGGGGLGSARARAGTDRRGKRWNRGKAMGRGTAGVTRSLVGGGGYILKIHGRGMPERGCTGRRKGPEKFGGKITREISAARFRL